MENCMANLTAAYVYRDFEADGIPSSGKHDPKKSDIRALLNQYETIISAFTSNGGLIYSSRASLYADLGHSANSMAWVIGDALAANNGIYGKVGSTGFGSWTRRSDLPFSFIVASNTGAGTPNAIAATTAVPVSASALIILNVTDTNTGPVTVSYNDGDPLSIKTNSGNDILPGGLISGMVLLGLISGGDFRLVNDQVSSAIVAAAESAADKAEEARDAAMAAANAGFVFDTEAAFLSADIPAILQFVQVAGYYVAGDGGGHIKRRITAPVIPKPWHSQSADGGWWEVAIGQSASPEMFGSRGNANFFNTADLKWYANSGLTEEATNDSPAIQAALDWATPLGKVVNITRRHRVVETIVLGKGRLRGQFPGQMNLSAGPALCADHGITSTRKADNTWDNPVIYADNSDDFIGGGFVTDLAILGSNQNRQDHLYRCPRTAIQGYFWINGTCQNVVVANFSKSGFSAVGLVQDRDLPGWWISNCGTNTDTSSGGEYVAGFETRTSTVDVGSFAAGRSPNALHWSGLRMEGCPAFVDINQGTRNVGEIDFKGCKFEVGTWQKFWDSPIRINGGAGMIYFGAGTHFTVPVSERDDGARVWFISSLNYQSCFDGCTFRGPVQMFRSTGLYVRVVGCLFENAPTAFAGWRVANGDIDISLSQNMASASGTRYGVIVGRNTKTSVKFFTLANSPTTVDVTSGHLVQTPVLTDATGGRPEIDIKVMDDGSAYRQVYRYYRDETGAFENLTQLIVNRISAARPITVTSILDNNLDVSLYGEELIQIGGSGLTVARLVRSSLGSIYRLYAVSSFVLDYGTGTYLKLKGGVSRTVAVGQVVSLLVVATNVAVEI